uniref:Uncharacterized protein n=1 Tax=Pipistrellus kuhlii TaxID=59472 RepID=A0A7J8AAA3_PIPKU|nr:hypothetical protein mPipKuh1_011986 [Pipistrellus kuhlii]
MEFLNENIIKLNRTANDAQEASQQTLGNLYTELEKLSNLSKANLKLEQQLDDALEQEKKVRMNVKGKSANWRVISSCTRRVWHLESSQLQLTGKLRK